jgi:hypothetical protein
VIPREEVEKYVMAAYPVLLHSLAIPRRRISENIRASGDEVRVLSHERPESGVKGHDLFLRICEEEKEA